MDALRGYETFYKLSRGSATLPQVVKSSAGVQRWAQFARVVDVVSQDTVDDDPTLDAGAANSLSTRCGCC